MTICPNCGEYILEDGNFCNNCGWVQEGAQIPKHLKRPKKKEKMSLEDWILFCICFTPCGALLYYIFFARTE